MSGEPRVEAARIAAALAGYDWQEIEAMPGRRNHRRAGVLVPLRCGLDPRVILTLRPESLRRHGGEVCFPGGRAEPEDVDLEDTARREAREELGITEAAMLGRLSSIPVFSSEFRLEPFVADIGEAPLVAQSSEVARIVEAPLSELCGGPHIDAVPYQRKGRSWLSPVFVIEGLAVFGATAHCLLELLDLLAPLGGLDRPPLVAGRFDWPCLFRHGARAGEAMGR